MACLDNILSAYLRLFPYRFESAVRRSGAQTWRLVSRFHLLTDEEIASALQNDSTLFRAFALDNKSSFLVLSIPASSKYKTADSLEQLIGLLHNYGMKPVPYSFNENWYLYLYFDRQVPTNRFSVQLKKLLESSGFETGVEVHQASDNVPFPLQPGFVWLDERAEVIHERRELTLEAALELYCAEIERSKFDPVMFESLDSIEQSSDCSPALDLQLVSEQAHGPVYTDRTSSDLQKTEERQIPSFLEIPLDMSSQSEGSSEHVEEIVDCIESSAVLDVQTDIFQQLEAIDVLLSDTQAYSTHHDSGIDLQVSAPVQTEPQSNLGSIEDGAPQLFLFPEHPTPVLPGTVADSSEALASRDADRQISKANLKTDPLFPQLSLFTGIDPESSKVKLPGNPDRKQKKDSKKAGRAPPDTG